jgi:hypothetical protein
VYVTKAFCCCNALAFLACFVKVATVESHFRAELAHDLHLRLIHVFRGCVNDDTCAEEPAGVSDRLTVIACRGSDKPATFFFVTRSADDVDAAAYFESAGCPASRSSRNRADRKVL